MKLYVAGPMFTPAERDHLDALADRLELAGHDCFVPHRQKFAPLDAATVFAVDGAGLREAEVVVAWLDGPMVDDGTDRAAGRMPRRTPEYSTSACATPLARPRSRSPTEENGRGSRSSARVGVLRSTAGLGRVV